MRIARDGTWYHQGSPIRRAPMVRLFSTILRREAGGEFVLVTPIEKLAIEVEDCPFVAVEVKSEGTGQDRTLAFRLNTGDVVVAGPENPLDFGSGEPPHPIIGIRDGLDALIARTVFYELVELALAEGETPPGLWSGGSFFAIGGRA